MDDDKQLPRLGWKYGGPSSIMFPFVQGSSSASLSLFHFLSCMYNFIYPTFFCQWGTVTFMMSYLWLGILLASRGLLRLSVAHRTRPGASTLQPTQCQWVTFCFSVSPITHTLPCPPSIPPFLSIPHLLHSHTHTIPPVQKDEWDVPKPQVLLYL